MGFAEWLIALLMAFAIVDLLILSLYCRLMRKLDRRRLARNMQKAVPEVGSTVENNSSSNGIKRLFGLLNPYLYGWMRYSTVLVGKIPSHNMRNWLMHHVFCMNITKNTVIYGGCEIRSPWNITADRCVISTYCILDGRNGITFGQDVVLGGGVHIWTEEHSIDDPHFGVLEDNRQPVSIGQHAWICSDSTILPGVTIGEGAVVASRAVLTRDADAFGVYAGIPAKMIRKRNENLEYQLNGKLTWHFY